MSTTSSAFGPSSCALGPHETGTQNAKHLCNEKSFASATIYYPTTSGRDGMELLPSIVIVGGWGCGEQALAAWAPFYASHGIVAMTIGTPSPWLDSPADRGKALLAASLALQTEHEREGSVLQGRLDVSRRAVQGFSLGGGGAQLAGLTDQTLKCVIALAPDGGKAMGYPMRHRLAFPSEPPTSVPVLIVSGERDTEGGNNKSAWDMYRSTGATKLIFEVMGADHYTKAGPAGGSQSQMGSTADESIQLCNCLSMIACIQCCNEFPRCWCVPCPNSTLDGPSGHAAATAPRGAIGGVALAWLRLFLLDDESARAQLALRPDIASGFESSGVAPLAMDR